MADPIFETVSLNTPLTVAGAAVASIRVRKPTPGEMRGVRLSLLLAMDVDAIVAVLPRVTEPVLEGETLSTMDVADFTQFGATLVGFLTGGRGLTI